MCQCTPTLRTPFCGKPGCEGPLTAEERLEIVERERAQLLDLIAGLKQQAAQAEAAVAYWKHAWDTATELLDQRMHTLQNAWDNTREARELAREGLEWARRLDEGLSISEPEELTRFHHFCLRVEKL